MRRPVKWLLIVAALVVAAVTIGPFVYINFIRDDAPDPLSFEERDDELADATTTVPEANTEGSTDAPSDTAGVDGEWIVTSGSEAGYRARENLFGQDADAVGRTTGVTGTIDISGTTVSAGSFTVDMTTIESNESLRDNQFQGRIMDTATFPTSTFSVAAPLDFGALPEGDEQITVDASGQLMLRGVTNDVTFPVQARLNGANLEVLGTIPVNFDDYAIPDASGGPASVGREGEVEFLLVFARA